MDKKIAIRGQMLSFSGDAFALGLADTMHHENDAVVVMQDGIIQEVGSADALWYSLGDDVKKINYGQDHLIMPGFIDSHVHYPQTQIMAAYGEQLIDWLNTYTFVAEQQFSDPSHAREVAEVFINESLRAGTTTSAVFATVHPDSVDAIFDAASERNMRMIAGKVWMDRHAPEGLLDTAQSAYDDSQALIKKWHGKGRNLYAITPRFAPTSSVEQLELAGALWQEHPSCYVQSHISESQKEIEWALSLFPDCKDYLAIYERFGLLGPRAIYGHGIWLSDDERARCAETGTGIAHCPTSNGFLGSGLFDLVQAKSQGLAVGLATDVGAGTSLSMLQTMNQAYQVAQLNGHALSAGHAFYLATRGTAEALQLADKVGSIEAGKEADVLVMDMKSTDLIDFRMGFAESFEEQLFIQMIMGDDRATAATYVAGVCVYQK